MLHSTTETSPSHTRDADPAADPELSRLRDEVIRLYGSRLDRLVLFGSRARGDHRPDSDYDVALFLKDGDRNRGEPDRLWAFTHDILMTTGKFITVLRFPAEDLDRQTPLMFEIRRDGIVLAGRQAGLGGGVSRRNAGSPDDGDRRERPTEDNGMRPITDHFLNNARKILDQARAIATIGIADVAAREAYMAAFHAAQAAIFEWRGRVVKTHKGVHTVFGEVLVERGLDRSLGEFVSKAYDYKSIADYEIFRTVDPEQVPSILEAAERVVAAVEAAIRQSRSGSSA